ncbi:hypothetical protein EKN56_06940 [Limnobaculum zhutongyuii]|uniref:Uncharacterized protein n=1 Tax=Limnobaculum zhutongyuii TaxID=2498113 RepID=A0A411WIZ3_9GAMM|nr:hypothetical protein [Limnobaculum zhutongyuii]QBH96152.1 hypothetical protein EKN56_06940 [Limnobaculum zhutongyuii]TQS87285.1 hypothetical protein ELQ32_14915 [Limnobaculum zhutongyuii]
MPRQTSMFGVLPSFSRQLDSSALKGQQKKAKGLFSIQGVALNIFSFSFSFLAIANRWERPPLGS